MGTVAGSTVRVLAPDRARGRGLVWWQVAVAVGAVVAGALAVAVTLQAGFLRYPGWLAAQKADFVIGPALTGLYWKRLRPHSWFGPMLIGWGFVGALYILQSSGDRWPFTIGLFWEKVFGLGTYVLILAFPTGRLDRQSRILLVGGVVTVLLLAVTIQLLQPQVGAGGSISSCRSLCPQNELAVTDDPALAHDLFVVFSYAVLALALAVTALLAHRFATGTPPRRRALAMGLPVAALFLLCEMTYQLLNILGDTHGRLYGIVIWLFVAARAAVWYGFLFALIAAELFAARALAQLVEQSLQHPSRQQVEVMLREPLGDPTLRLRFLDRSAEPDAERLAIEAGPGRDVSVVEREGSPAVAILHDPQLNDDPELLMAAGEVALLAAENAELEAGWKNALGDLERSQARLLRATDDERHKVERDLHDGVQQHLLAIMVRLRLGPDRETIGPSTREWIADNVGAALEELREVAHGLSPLLLRQQGLVAALQLIQLRTPVRLTLNTDGVGRYSPDVESAVYYCSMEAIQNATKHGGASDLHITLTLREQGDELRFDVQDDGAGFVPDQVNGSGLQNMQDRIGALGGHLTVRSAPGLGATVSGRVGRRRPSEDPRPG